MSQEILTPVSRCGEYLEVHPTALANHKEFGWSECERREAAEEPKPKAKKAATDETATKAGE